MPDGAALDEYRHVIAALDRIDASDIFAGPYLRAIANDVRRGIEALRDAAEDLLFEAHGRLGFESEKHEQSPPAPEQETPRQAQHRTAPHRPGLRETVLASGEQTNALAARLGVSVARVGRIRLEAGDRCSFLTGSALTAGQRAEIAASQELTSALAARHGVSKNVVDRIRKSGG